MILYFSGTGNSTYVANYIAKQVNDDAVNLLVKFRNHDYSMMKSGRPCPKGAIEYGKASQGKPRYTCPNNL